MLGEFARIVDDKNLFHAIQNWLMAENADEIFSSFCRIQHNAIAICVKRTKLVLAAVPALSRVLGSLTDVQRTTVRLQYLAY